MSGVVEGDRPGPNAPEFTVTEISGAVKRVVEGEFPHVRVRGEIGRVARPRSGHLYLDLKDDRNVLSGVVWKGVAGRLATQPEEGLEVVATGRLTTFGGQSRYQLVIEDLAPAGVGALMAMLEKRKAALEAEGLFAESAKRPLPFLPEVIGLVTSPTGAVIRDILHRLRDRFPRRVLLWPVAVQGQACAGEVATAIAGFDALAPGGPIPRPDLLIVARGGGSIEDLWGFNEEVVARAASASAIPLISAVGHETDTTLIDYVADRRAPTPSAAAELAVPVRLELLARLDGQAARLTRAGEQAVARRRQRLVDLARALPRPAALVAQARQRFDQADERLPAALRAAAQAKRVRLAEAAASLRPALLSRRIGQERRSLALSAGRLPRGLRRTVAQGRERLDQRAARLRLRVLTADVAQKRRAHDALARRFADAARRDVAARRTRLAALERLRGTLGYEATLARGYAVVRGEGAVVTDKAVAETCRALEIEFRDGRLSVGGATPRKATSRRDAPGQGSLF